MSSSCRLLGVVVSDPSLATYTAQIRAEMEDRDGLALTLSSSSAERCKAVYRVWPVV